MHSSLDVFPHLKNGLRFFWKFCLNLCLQKWLRPNFNLVFILIPLGLWQFKIKFEDNLVNSQILFLEAQRTSEFLIFKSGLFHSMKVNRKENCWKKKKMFTVIISSCIIICFANARRFLLSLKRYSGNWFLNLLKKFLYNLYHCFFYIIVFYGVILGLALDKAFLYKYLL